MDFSVNNARAQKVWCDSENLWILLFDGRQLSIPLIFFPKLMNADKELLSQYELSGNGIGEAGYRFMGVYQMDGYGER